MDYGSNINLLGNELQNARIQNLATDPTGTLEGLIYFNTTDKKLKVYNGSGWVYASALTGVEIVALINACASLIDDNNLSAAVNAAITNSHTHSNKVTLDAIEVAFTTAMNTKLSGIEVGADVTDAVNVAAAISGSVAKATPADADVLPVLDCAASFGMKKFTWANLKTALSTVFNNYVHPNHTGDVTSVADGATTISANAVTTAKILDANVTNAKLANMAQNTIKGRKTASTGVPEDLTATDLRTIINVADGADVTGSAINAATAKATPVDADTMPLSDSAASFGIKKVTFANLKTFFNYHSHSNKALLDTYTQTEANLADAVTKRHAQNTDTGTNSSTFQIGTGGPRVKSSGTEMHFRNAADTDYSIIRAKELYLDAEPTRLAGNIVELGDNDIELNTEITTAAQNSDGGLTVKRLHTDNSTRKDAKITWSESLKRWVMSRINAAATVTAVAVSGSYTQDIGDGTNANIVVTHMLNTKAVHITVRYKATDKEIIVDNESTTADTVTLRFGTIPTAAQYYVTITG